MKYLVQYGCDEWQEEDPFIYYAQAKAYISTFEKHCPTMGAYPATYAHISFDDNIVMEVEL